MVLLMLLLLPPRAWEVPHEFASRSCRLASLSLERDRATLGLPRL
jgi:hypothetical protein